MSELYLPKLVDANNPILCYFLNSVSYNPCFTATGESLCYV